jgi:hypothetical protein
MSLSPGTRVGPYEVTAKIGAGGMSACGHGEPRTCRSEARHRRQFRVDSLERLRGADSPSNGGGGGVPAASEEMVGPHAQ